MAVIDSADSIARITAKQIAGAAGSPVLTQEQEAIVVQARLAEFRAVESVLREFTRVNEIIESNRDDQDIIEMAFLVPTGGGVSLNMRERTIKVFERRCAAFEAATSTDASSYSVQGSILFLKSRQSVIEKFLFSDAIKQQQTLQAIQQNMLSEIDVAVDKLESFAKFLPEEKKREAHAYDGNGSVDSVRAFAGDPRPSVPAQDISSQLAFVRGEIAPAAAVDSNEAPKTIVTVQDYSTSSPMSGKGLTHVMGSFGRSVRQNKATFAVGFGAGVLTRVAMIKLGFAVAATALTVPHVVGAVAVAQLANMTAKTSAAVYAAWKSDNREKNWRGKAALRGLKDSFSKKSLMWMGIGAVTGYCAAHYISAYFSAHTTAHAGITKPPVPVSPTLNNMHNIASGLAKPDVPAAPVVHPIPVGHNVPAAHAIAQTKPAAPSAPAHNIAMTLAPDITMTHATMPISGNVPAHVAPVIMPDPTDKIDLPLNAALRADILADLNADALGHGGIRAAAERMLKTGHAAAGQIMRVIKFGEYNLMTMPNASTSELATRTVLDGASYADANHLRGTAARGLFKLAARALEHGWFVDTDLGKAAHYAALFVSKAVVGVKTVALAPS